MDDRDPPIDELGYRSGVTVVDIGDYRVSRGRTRREFSGCGHKRLSYDERERRIWCRDCERDIEAFDVFVSMIDGYNTATKKLDKRRQEINEAENFSIRSLAAKAIDKAWRSRSMVPACPHCNNGLFPESFKNGAPAMISKDYALARSLKNKES